MAFYIKIFFKEMIFLKKTRILAGMSAAAIVASMMSALPASAALNYLTRRDNNDAWLYVESDGEKLSAATTFYKDEWSWSEFKELGTLTVDIAITDKSSGINYKDISLQFYGMGTTDWDWQSGAFATFDNAGKAHFTVDVAKLNPKENDDIEFGIQAYLNDSGIAKVAEDDEYSFNYDMSITYDGEKTETVYASSADELKTTHNIPEYSSETFHYRKNGEKALKITFSEQTNIGGGSISISNDYNDYYFYTDDLAGKSIVILGNEFFISASTEDEAAYGFDIVSVESGDPDDAIGAPKSIKNGFMKVVAAGENFSIGTTGGDPDNNRDDDATMLYGFSGAGTSRTTIRVDEDMGYFSADSYTVDNTADVPTMYATGKYNGIDVTAKFELLTNVATGQADVVRVSYTYENNGTASHNVGCKIMMDTMLGDNDHAPFRVPGTGDVTVGKTYKGSDIPQSWQAFDNLSEPTVIAQGSFLRDVSNPPDEVRFTSYGNATDSWSEVNANEGEENGDSAVEVFWYPRALAPGQSTTFSTYYGLSELVQNMTPPLTLSLSGDSFASQVDYDDDKGQAVYNKLIYTAYLNNIDTEDVVNATATLTIPEGFKLVNKEGNTATRTFAKVAPGEIIQVDWELEIDAASVTDLNKYPMTLTTDADNDVEKTVSKNLTIPETLTEKVSISKTEVDGNLTYTYTGKEIVPEFKLLNGETELIEGGNYTVEYKNNVEAGKATAVFTGIGMYSGTKEVEFDILPADIQTLSVKLDKDQFTYSGAENKPNVTVSFANAEQALDSSLFEVAYSNNVNASDPFGGEYATATVTSKSPNFTGSVTKQFAVLKADLTQGAEMTLSADSYTYDGNEKRPDVSVKFGGKDLVFGDDYTVTYEDNLNAGTATAYITGMGNYQGELSKTFTIKAAAISANDVTLASSAVTYTGSAQTPAVTVKSGSKTLVSGSDYTVSYSNNTNAGTATATVTAKGNYTGTVTKQFTVQAADISKADISGVSDAAFTGSAIKPTPVVKLGGKTLAANTDYTVTYKNNTNAGTATVTVTGKGNYAGTASKTFKITAVSIAKAKVSGVSAKVYTGKAIKPTVTVKLGTKTLKKGTDYTVSYKNNKAVGTATITIKGKGNYSGTVSKTFKINPKATTVSKVTSPKTKQLKVTYKKTTGVTGYQVTYSTSKSFKKADTKSVTVKGTSKTIKSLKKGTIYYVKVRTYKTVGKTKYYSAYSKVKSVKVK